jgi:hypothetical protein
VKLRHHWHRIVSLSECLWVKGLDTFTWGNIKVLVNILTFSLSLRMNLARNNKPKSKLFLVDETDQLIPTAYSHISKKIRRCAPFPCFHAFPVLQQNIHIYRTVMCVTAIDPRDQ